LAGQAVQDGYSPIIAAGGDGTISEIVNGILEACGESPAAPLGIIPLGSANDLVKNIGLPAGIPEAARVIASCNVRQMDIGQVLYDDNPSPRYFDNNSAMGLEPTVTLIEQRITRLTGVLRYLVATLMGVYQNPHWNVVIEWEGGEYSGPVSLVTVGNCALTGGLFYMTPHADPYDSKLTFVYAYLPTRWQILKILPRTMKPGEGSYVEHPAVHEIHSPWITLTFEMPTPLHADGEIQSERARKVSYSILPGRLPVITGAQ
jgi:diacylglycerol kinase family enzyme